MKKERDRNKFEITYGNLIVLKTIPDMMIEKSWRNKLRKLVIEYIIEQSYKNKLKK